ncbi:MAG TPA: PfkB family carbohydrate kinase, partial [Myxococcaceae bacterium]|nr:PfkB family carbohydrate kinase [Myxococcaceae bacterium]
ALRAGVTFAKPSRREFESLVGRPLNVKELASAAAEWVGLGWVEVLVVSLGAAGAILATRQGVHYAAPPPVSTASSVGAGDSLVAGVLTALSRGDSTLEAFRIGVAAGTAALLRSGTEPCKRSEVERLMPEVRPEPVSLDQR